MVWADFLKLNSLLVSVDFLIGSVLIEKDLHRPPLDQHKRVMYFCANPGKISKGAIINATVLKTVALTPCNKFFNKLNV